MFPAAEVKKKIKGEGRPASVNREREACGRPCSLWFFLNGNGGRRSLPKKTGLGLGFSFLYFSDVSKIDPPCLSCGPVFIGKMLYGSPNWSFNFLSFFVNLIFLNFFYFLKTSNINVDSMKKINDFKNNTLKVERVPNVFENLNSFETMLKNAKNDTNV